MKSSGWGRRRRRRRPDRRAHRTLRLEDALSLRRRGRPGFPAMKQIPSNWVAFSLATIVLVAAACDDSGDSASTSANAGAAPTAQALVTVETEFDFYTARELAVAVVENETAAPIFLDSCTPIYIQESLDGDWTLGSGVGRCVQPGLPDRIDPNERMELVFPASRDSGFYRVMIEPMEDCEAGLRLPFANCSDLPIVHSEEFEVARELCDPSDPGCRFVPAQPNILCPDGIFFSGPAAECTRDPIRGDCGYEILVCP